MENRHPTTGFLLLPPSPKHKYRGVDRYPFEPALLPSEIDPAAQVQVEESRIWVLYPPSWRRDAYRLYEENLAEVRGDLYLLRSVEVAYEIKQLIEPHLGPHEVIRCEVWFLDFVASLEDTIGSDFLGYDIAYPGGDFYSAILNGLLVNPHPVLVEEFKHLLNEFGLFSTSQSILEYVRRFRELVPSETESVFCVFRLSLAHR